MNNHITSYGYKSSIAQTLLEDMQGNNHYYLFVGDHMPHSDSNLMIYDTTMKTYVNPYRKMISGKRVVANNLALMIRNIPYETNKVFDMYDDDDDFLYTKDYFCVVNASSYYHVYKCLDNNGDANSTVEPNFVDITGSNVAIYQTSDGYRWKYMYSFTSAQKNSFATSEFVPVFANTENEAAVVDGSLSIIKIEDAGDGYNNYFNGTFVSTDINVNGNTYTFQVSNSNQSTVNGYYSDCIIYLSSGSGSGQYRTIVDYISNINGNFIIIDTPFTTAPTNGTEYQITPKVNIAGDGGQTNAVARALVNSTSSNSIYRVEILTPGANYSYAAANVSANVVVGIVRAANVRPIMSSPGGHASKPAEELGASRLAISVYLTNTESNTILANNQYQQIGLIKNPIFDNVLFDMTSVEGIFISGETVYKLNPVRLDTFCTTSITNGDISCANGDFVNQLSANQYVYITNADASLHQLAQINTITNSSFLSLTVNGFFACTSAILYDANLSSNALVSNVESLTQMYVSNVTSDFFTSDTIIGLSSGAHATIDVISRNGVAKGFNTFNQLYKYDGTVVSGTFQQNEVVYQNSLALANADLHSSVVNSTAITLYTSRQSGAFDAGGGNTIIGNTSGAIAEVVTKYNPEIRVNSGTILYIENTTAINRETANSEHFNIILEY